MAGTWLRGRGSSVVRSPHRERGVDVEASTYEQPRFFVVDLARSYGESQASV